VKVSLLWSSKICIALVNLLNPQVRVGPSNLIKNIFKINLLTKNRIFTVDFNALIEQRRRERTERMRHRFLDMRSTHLRHDNTGAPYTVTVLRPPSDETLSESQEAGDRTQQDPSSKANPQNKPEKND